MPMQMSWRWYGEGNDPVKLSDIRQIPGVTSIVWALHNKLPGEIWKIDEIQQVADQIHAYFRHGLVVVLDHILLIEQGGGAVADGMEQVGAGPVEDGHEIVAQ
mgnify:CR=1 FL=1